MENTTAISIVPVAEVPPHPEREPAIAFEADLLVNGHQRYLAYVYEDELENLTIDDLFQIFARTTPSAHNTRDALPGAQPIVVMRFYATEKGLAVAERLGAAAFAVASE